MSSDTKKDLPNYSSEVLKTITHTTRHPDSPAILSRGDAPVGGRSYPKLSRKKVAASMDVITSGAKWGVLIGSPMLLRESCRSDTVITPTPRTQSTISARTKQHVLGCDLNNFQEMIICGHLTLGLEERKGIG